MYKRNSKKIKIIQIVNYQLLIHKCLIIFATQNNNTTNRTTFTLVFDTRTTTKHELLFFRF